MADDELVGEMLAEYEDDATELAYQLKAGNISTNEWRDRMAELIAVIYLMMWLFGRQSASVPSDERAVIEELLDAQYEYLDAFATQIDEFGISDVINVTDFSASDIVGGAGALSLIEVIRRAKMYIKSARQAFERAKSYAYGELPAYPGDGTSLCLSNCQCHWELQFSANNLVAYWRLGVADHCKTCTERASTWNPYILPLEEVN